MTADNVTILVVDDEAHIVQVVSLKLRNAGYEVMTAVDGEEAFELARRDLPDLVITDFQMPYMSGLDLCRSLAEHEPTRHIPVLMLTARGYALDEQDLAIGNIRNVIAKPFSPRAVLQQVEEILNECAGEEGTGGQQTGDEGQEAGDRGQESGDTPALPPDSSIPRSHDSSMPSSSESEAA